MLLESGVFIIIIIFFFYFLFLEVYPKVKVRVQKEEDDLYAYEKRSLESLKAFEWLSLHHSSSSDESPVSVVRVPQSYAPNSPSPSFLTSKVTDKKKAVVEENTKNARPASAPRPRAVLSSPDNDGIIGSKTQTRGKNRHSSRNRHTQCKIFPKSSADGSFAPTQGYNKESSEAKNDDRAKCRRAVGDLSIGAGYKKKITPQST